MLTLLIAEDEAIERRALRFLLDKYYSDSIKVAAEVTNGRDAVDKALLLKPDIILMDIHMPILDGLEASNTIKDNLKDTEFIILTAFNYFDYAKKAINIGVSDYLLKPFSNDEFFEALDKVIEKVNLKISAEIENKELKENYKKVIPYIEKEMIANIVYGVSLTEEQLNEYRDILDLESDKYCCILFNLGGKKSLDENSLQIIKGELSTLFTNTIIGLCLNDAAVFAFDKEIDGKILSNAFENALNSLRNNFKLSQGRTLSIGVGSINQGMNKLYISYKEAKRSCGEEKNDEDESIDYYSILCGKIINEDYKGAVSEVDLILNVILNKNEVIDLMEVKKIFLNIFDKVAQNIQEFVGSDFKSLDKEKLPQGLADLKDIADLKHYFSVVIRNFINYISSYKKSKNIDVIEKVKKYIEHNYMNEINLDILAQYVSMSSFYLSRIFSKVENASIKEYIIMIRMEKAKSMLLEGTKSVKQIAIDVGYQDQNYFSKAFKKYTNLSPTEYCSR